MQIALKAGAESTEYDKCQFVLSIVLVVVMSVPSPGRLILMPAVSCVYVSYTPALPSCVTISFPVMPMIPGRLHVRW